MSPLSKANLFTYTLPTPTERFLAAPLLFLAHWIYTHQPPITAPKPAKNPIKVVCISDTHTACPRLPAGDILIHAGDLTNNGTFPEVQRQLTWLSSQPHAHRVVIAGNHDLLLDPVCYGKQRDLFASAYAWQRETDLRWRGVAYLEAEASALWIRGRDVRVFGSPWTSAQGNWAFQYARYLSSSSNASEAERIWHTAVPRNTHILVTHGPSLGHLDAQQGSRGCAALLQELWQVKPRLHIHGHTHRARGTEVLDWGVVQWCYDQMCMGGRGVYGARLTGVGLLLVAFVVWVWEWRLYVMYGTSRVGRSVVVNAAWEGNEERGVEVVEM